MNLFRRSRKQAGRAVVIGLDGMPRSLMQKLLDGGRMPHFAALLAHGRLLPMQSVLPTVSSVAWASVVTGCNPAKHNIFGFIDRVPLTYEMFIPTSRHMLAKTWVELFSGLGRRVFSMGIPTTYPPRAVNGVLISGFLAPDLRKATYPLQVARELEQMGYVIDIDAWQARADREKFLDEVFNALERRLEAMLRFFGREPWDLFVAHIMDTDRLHHFLWEAIRAEDGRYMPWVHRFYDRIDRAIGEVAGRLAEDTLLMVLSDHGFCRLKQEVHLNHWLREAGYQKVGRQQPKQLKDLDPGTRCYSLLPGRFYLSVRGREYNGCVDPGQEYGALREEIASGLMEIRDPETGERAIRRVFMREEIYSGDAFELAPDFVAMPAEGYDLKGGFGKDRLMRRSPVNGTHTFDDAMFYVNRPVAEGKDLRLVDVMPTLLEAMGLEIPQNVDGRSVLEA